MTLFTREQHLELFLQEASEFLQEIKDTIADADTAEQIEELLQRFNHYLQD
jgi:hypothetical protein